MTKNETLYEKSQKNCDDVFDLCCPETELISEEKLPSLFSLSLSESVCSDSTMDFSIKEPVSHQLASTLDSHINNEVKECESEEHIGQQQNGSTPNKFRKCMSLHDVSDMIPSQMTPKSVNTVSCETIHSQSLSSTTKSKDSGFHRSVSCLSLTSGKRNYDHIESKVKAYIKNIKESEALRKKNKLIMKQKCEILHNPELTIADNENDIVMDKEDLLIKIQELKHELHEKSLYIDAQQKNYNSLLLKFAEAKNTIDSLRLQRISLDYSSLNGSRCTNSRIHNFNLDDFFQEINNKSNNIEIFRNSTNDKSNKLKEKCPEQVSVSSSISNNSLIEGFKPNLHSTPDKSKSFKCLSPVSKLFSSSFRLDKQCQPLVSIQKQSNHPNNCGTSSKYCGTANKPAQLFQSSAKKPKQSSAIGLINKKKHSDVKQKRESTSKLSNHIDLPYVDPFDKVKKWQASLPNINLLGTQSSSDHEDLNTEENDGEINSLLSQELVTKCKISEVENNHQDYKQSSGPRNDRVKLYSTENNKKTKNYSQIDGYSSDSVGLKNSHHLKKSGKSIRLSHVQKVVNPPSNEVSKSKTSVPVLTGNTSVSEDESQSYMPRSSSVSYTGRTVLKSDTSDDSCTDDNSSISSSVLGSNPYLPSKKSKRKHLKDKFNLFNKIPKLNVNKKLYSNFVLREPRLNVTIPDEDVVKDQRNSQCSDSNSRNLNLRNFNLKTESSQRKAWNARNNANFYVCKEFDYKHKSSTLQNCITDMEGMVKKSFPIIDNVLERSICK